MDPQWGQSQSDLDSRLANQGIVQGSEAYNRSEDNFARARNDAYNQANYSAIGAGNALQNQLYGQSLAGRQQAIGEANTQGQFANQAQQQQYDQALQNAGFANAAQAQAYGQNMGAANFGNSAQAQQYAQNAQNLALNNQARAQGFGEAGALGSFANDAQAQAYAQALQNANFGNQARSQGLTEQTNLQMLPLNELNALRSSSQVQMPTFNQVPQSGVQPTNVSGNVWNAYNANVANSNNFMNGLFGLGGAAITAFSDARLKRNLKLVARTVHDLAVYEFEYLWSAAKQIGVLAQDVLSAKPDAVLVHPSGYLMVDYGRLG